MIKTMTSLEVAAITGIKHRQVKEAIKDMEPAWESVNGSKFQQTSESVYVLSKVQSLFIAGRFAQDEREMLSIYWDIFD